jgi:hypothetical protein
MSKDAKLYINIMAFVILIAAVLLLSSCAKEEPVIEAACNCGEVISKKKVQHIVFGNWIYELTLDNNCTGSDTIYGSTQSEYNNYLLGDTYCFPSKTW